MSTLIELPKNLVRPNTFLDTDNADLKRPVFGDAGKLPVRISKVQVFLQEESKKQKREVTRAVEIVEFYVDKYTRVVKKIPQLTEQEAMDTAPLYEKFLSQQENTETDVLDWKGANRNEQAWLLSMNVLTVEDLARATGSKLNRLGVRGMQLQERAKWHLRTKNETRIAEGQEDMQKLMQENEHLAQKVQELEQKMYERHAAAAEGPRARSRGRNVPVSVPEPVAEIAFDPFSEQNDTSDEEFDAALSGMPNGDEDDLSTSNEPTVATLISAAAAKVAAKNAKKSLKPSKGKPSKATEKKVTKKAK